MEHAGRKSGASVAALGLVSGTLGVRLEPPKELNAAEAAVWREIAAQKPADWFGPDTAPLLTAYCRATIEAHRLSRLLKSISLEDGTSETIDRYERLLRLTSQNSTTMKALATAMRLSQQSKYGARGAASHAEKAGAATKPWQSTR